MHVRGARRTGRATRVHGRRAGGVRRAGHVAGVRRYAWRAAVRGHAAVRAAGQAGACGYGCTVHRRALPSPRMMELT
ncbi:hypothetical protein CDL15_Pgr005055 [Punica granatum]|uniref:Uncharacterized protein n=1 Tax=Punica granatum TaxID=22663 RepID=A0A218W2C5_PUNGR|nr:hypothetical protein CDL15_Pgr005055 [Punica granatum]PKI60624.1 hypothetical protein CRG98_018974 [Punica granatum]